MGLMNFWESAAENNMEGSCKWERSHPEVSSEYESYILIVVLLISSLTIFIVTVIVQEF